MRVSTLRTSNPNPSPSLNPDPNPDREYLAHVLARILSDEAAREQLRSAAHELADDPRHLIGRYRGGVGEM